MIMGYASVALLLLVAGNWLFKASVRKKQERKAQENKRRQLLIRLRDADRFDPEGYDGKTKEEMEQNQLHIHVLMERLMKTEEEVFPQLPDLEKEVAAMEANTESISSGLKNQTKRWDQDEQEVERILKQAVSFIEQTHFYPADFPFKINKLNGMMMELHEERRKDPLHFSKETLQEAQELKAYMEEFQLLHKELALLVEEYKKVEGTFSSKETQAVMERRQLISIFLQKGKLKQAKKELKELRKHAWKKAKIKND